MEESQKLKEIRKKIFLTAYSAGIGHLASAFSTVEILYALYMKKVLKYDLEKLLWKDRDRLVLSKGHASLALYVMLCQAGFFSEEILRGFCKPGSCLGGEPSVVDIPGIEASTGSLGHGLSIGVGMAFVQKVEHSVGKTYVIIGDGECQEGTIWEAAMSASKFELENLIVILDCNGVQKMDKTTEIMGEERWRQKWEAFGWEVSEVDGHNVSQLKQSFQKEAVEKKPRLIIANTVKGKGVSIMENEAKWHFKMPNKRELRIFMEELGITQEELEKCR